MCIVRLTCDPFKLKSILICWPIQKFAFCFACFHFRKDIFKIFLFIVSFLFPNFYNKFNVVYLGSLKLFLSFVFVSVHSLGLAFSIWTTAKNWIRHFSVISISCYCGRWVSTLLYGHTVRPNAFVCKAC